MKLKDYKFKCERFSRHDFDGYAGVMEVSTLDGIILKSYKYADTHDKESPYSKQTCKKELIEFLKKYEKEIAQDIERIRTNRA